MDKTELIRRVMAEVQDPALREALLREIVEKSKPDAAGSSLIVRELDALGVNVEGVKDYSRFHLKAARVVGYLVGGLFAFGGGAIALLNLISGSIGGALFPGFFAAMGIYALISTRKLGRIVKK